MLAPAGSNFSIEELKCLFAPIAHMKGIGLAVSGGADSLALMVLVHRWLSEQAEGPEVMVFTVDHGLRQESVSECESVEAIAAQFGFAARTLVWQGGKPENGIQAAARRARYVLMGQAMKADHVEILLTGHHGDDQAETVLMRLAHSSGLAGLRGMQKTTRIMGTSVFRPFLDIPQKRLAETLATANLAVVHDPSNQNRKYERVRWRNMAEPLAEMGLDTPVLTRFATRMGRANRALEEVARRAFEQKVEFDQFCVGSIPEKSFLELGDEIGIRVLSKMIFTAGGGRSKGGLGQLESIVDALFGARFQGVAIGGCMVQKFRSKIVVFREKARIDHRVVHLSPLEETVWDQRFTIKNQTRNTIEIELAKKVTREQVRELEADSSMVPVAALRALPLIKNRQNQVLAFGGHVFTNQVVCELVQHQ